MNVKILKLFYTCLSDKLVAEIALLHLWRGVNDFLNDFQKFYLKFFKRTVQ